MMTASRLLTTKEAAAYCRFETVHGLHAAHRAGKVRPASRRGRAPGVLLWSAEDLDAFLRGIGCGAKARRARLRQPPVTDLEAHADDVLDRLAYLAKHGKPRPLKPEALPRRREAPSASVRRAVIARDGLICQICREPVSESDIHLDHIKPYSLGGPTTLRNLRVTHSVCNMRRGARETP